MAAVPQRVDLDFGDAAKPINIPDATSAGDAHTLGGADVPVADGGTGASDAATARTNLGVPGSTDVTDIVEISQTAYDALGGGRPAGRLYIVTS